LVMAEPIFSDSDPKNRCCYNTGTDA